MMQNVRAGNDGTFIEEQHRAMNNQMTGEEEDECLFCEFAQLFEFESATWKGRGKGNLRINRNMKDHRARLVMKGHNGLHLLLNANLWDGIIFSKMEGTTHGLTFACVNHVRPSGQAKKEEAEKEEGKELTTYAIRFREKNAGKQLASFIECTKDCLVELKRENKKEAGEGEANPTEAAAAEEQV